MSQADSKVKITPADHGRRMSLADFEDADVQAGYHYELGRGAIVVSEVPNPWHEIMISVIRRQFSGYEIAHPNRVVMVASGNGCKILLRQLGSERHPDVAVYLTPPPAQDSTAWRVWIPEIVVEVVSPDSRERDYIEKREEYHRFGVHEYWIFDREKQELLRLQRSSGDSTENIIRPPSICQTPLLPGMDFDCGAVFKAGA